MWCFLCVFQFRLINFLPSKTGFCRELLLNEVCSNNITPASLFLAFFRFTNFSYDHLIFHPLYQTRWTGKAQRAVSSLTYALLFSKYTIHRNCLRHKFMGSRAVLRIGSPLNYEGQSSSWLSGRNFKLQNLTISCPRFLRRQAFWSAPLKNVLMVALNTYCLTQWLLTLH